MLQRNLHRAALAMTLISGALAAQDLNVEWDKGLKFRSADQAFDFKIGGRVHYDWAFMSNDASVGAATTDGTEFRRARLYLQGKLWKNIEFKSQYDFEDGVADFKDVYIGLKVGSGKIRAGQYKEPSSLEELTSSNNITLMERSAMNGLVPSRQAGVSYRNAVGKAKMERLAYQFGVFRPTNTTLGGAGNAGDANANNQYNFSGRISGLPIFEKGEQLLHLGLSLSLREYNQDAANGSTGVRYRGNREAHLGNRLLSTGTMADADSAFVYGLEAAYARGPLSVQAEYTSIQIDSVSNLDPTISGYYLQVAYTLTGESRSYKNYDAVFGGITPQRNYGEDGFGAFELALRYSGLDFSDVSAFAAPTTADGKLTSYSVGANWYLNPNSRIMANYLVTDAGGSGAGTGEETALQLRFQVAF